MTNEKSMTCILKYEMANEVVG